MAYSQDTTKNFTITLIGPLEGLAVITGISFNNLTSGAESDWNYITSGWSNSIEAMEGDNIDVCMSIKNDGLGPDTMWAQFSSAEVTPNESDFLTMDLDVATSFWMPTWTFTMPPNNVNITFLAGHVEE